MLQKRTNSLNSELIRDNRKKSILTINHAVLCDVLNAMNNSKLDILRKCWGIIKSFWG